jgi:hypothetical protein
MRRTAAAALLPLLLGACLPIGTASPTPAANTTGGSPSTAASAPRITPPPVTPPTPPGSNLPAFACANAGGGTTGAANVTMARVAETSDFDRFVLQFDQKVPTYTVKRQPKPTFVPAGGGQPITLSGTAGVQVTVPSSTGASTFSGPTDLSHPEYQVLKEARLVQDQGGTVVWGLGLASAACLRTFTLSNPPRLVVDFRTTST